MWVRNFLLRLKFRKTGLPYFLRRPRIRISSLSYLLLRLAFRHFWLPDFLVSAIWELQPGSLLPLVTMADQTYR